MGLYVGNSVGLVDGNDDGKLVGPLVTVISSDVVPPIVVVFAVVVAIVANVVIGWGVGSGGWTLADSEVGSRLLPLTSDPINSMEMVCNVNVCILILRCWTVITFMII